MEAHSDGPPAWPQRRGPEVGATLSHFSYSQHCSRIALERREVAKVFLQVRRGGVIRCGQVIACEDFDGVEFFKLETESGQVWAPARSTRLCSFDGHCTCEGAR